MPPSRDARASPGIVSIGEDEETVFNGSDLDHFLTGRFYGHLDNPAAADEQSAGAVTAKFSFNSVGVPPHCPDCHTEGRILRDRRRCRLLK